MLDLSGEYQSEDEFQFFRPGRVRAVSSSSEEEDPNSTVSLPDTRSNVPLVKMVYIDGYNSIEKVKISEAMSHITTQKRKIKILAQQSELVFNRVKQLAEETGMKVNKKKRNFCVFMGIITTSLIAIFEVTV